MIECYHSTCQALQSAKLGLYWVVHIKKCAGLLSVYLDTTLVDYKAWEHTLKIQFWGFNFT